jgi:hypothetical protein
MNKNHDKILDESGLQDLSLTARITPIAIMVWKLQKITRRYRCAVKNLDQFWLPTVLDKHNYRIWKSVLQKGCRKFSNLSNGISYGPIGLTEQELCLFYCTSNFHIARKIRIFVSSLHISSLGCQKVSVQNNLSRKSASYLPCAS